MTISILSVSIIHTCICLYLPLCLFSRRVLASQLTENDLFHTSRNIINFNCHLRKTHQPSCAFCFYWVNRLTYNVTDHLLRCTCTKREKTESDGGPWCEALNLNFKLQDKLKKIWICRYAWLCFIGHTFVRHRVCVSTFMNKDGVPPAMWYTEDKGVWESNCSTSIWYPFSTKIMLVLMPGQFYTSMCKYEKPPKKFFIPSQSCFWCNNYNYLNMKRMLEINLHT